MLILHKSYSEKYLSSCYAYKAINNINFGGHTVVNTKNPTKACLCLNLWAVNLYSQQRFNRFRPPLVVSYVCIYIIIASNMVCMT